MLKARLVRPNSMKNVTAAVDSISLIYGTTLATPACRTGAVKRALFAAAVAGHIRRESPESNTFTRDSRATPDKGNPTDGAASLNSHIVGIISALTDHARALHCVTLTFVTLHRVTQRVIWHVHQNPD